MSIFYDQEGLRKFCCCYGTMSRTRYLWNNSPSSKGSMPRCQGLISEMAT